MRRTITALAALGCAGLLLGGAVFVRGQAPKRGAPVLVGLVTGDPRDPYVWVVGAHDPATGWRKAEQARAGFTSGTAFTAYAITPAGRTSRLLLDRAPEEQVNGWVAHAKGTLPTLDGQALLALSAPSPRVVKAARPQALASPIYERAVTDLLRTKKVRTARARLTEHLRLDMIRVDGRTYRFGNNIFGSAFSFRFGARR